MNFPFSSWFIFCWGLGCDVWLLLHGPLHGKLLDHPGSGLPEIHEQPRQAQEFINWNNEAGRNTRNPPVDGTENVQSYRSSNVIFRAFTNVMIVVLVDHLHVLLRVLMSF